VDQLAASWEDSARIYCLEIGFFWLKTLKQNLAKCQTSFHGFAHNFFVYHSFLAREVSTRRS
jgi:hypothetical protein